MWFLILASGPKNLVAMFLEKNEILISFTEVLYFSYFIPFFETMYVNAQQSKFLCDFIEQTLNGSNINGLYVPQITSKE